MSLQKIGVICLVFKTSGKYLLLIARLKCNIYCYTFLYVGAGMLSGLVHFYGFSFFLLITPFYTLHLLIYNHFQQNAVLLLQEIVPTQEDAHGT